MTGFTRTLHTLKVDRFNRGAACVLVAFAFLSAWFAWGVLARVTLYEISQEARLEIDRAAWPIAAPVAGRIVRVELEVGREIKAGDPLIWLDSRQDELRVAETASRLTTIARDLEALRQQIAVEERARAEEQQAAQRAVAEKRARAREFEESAAFAAHEAERSSALRTSGLTSERDHQRALAEARSRGASVESERISIERLEGEQQTRDSDRSAKLKRLEVERIHLEGEAENTRAALEKLRYDVERRIIRAPVEGRIAESAVVRPGVFLTEGERIGAILPEGRMAVVAHFAPGAAIGRIRPEQTAHMRLDSFPWAQFGALEARVTRVANELRQGKVRVELTLKTGSELRIPIEHGLPGLVEVEVERISPMRLLLRSAGRMISSPRSAYPALAAVAETAP